jgi:bifunctional UDP-N-acetylglucosamine pyrophosphorylase/glucosamine-1-phosphate N-acetyltransferase
MNKSLICVTLAAGLGTRMKSDMPKVLHKIGGRSMLTHVLALANDLGSSLNAVVLGPEVEGSVAEIIPEGVKAKAFFQRERLGTAHAVLAAREAIEGHEGHVIILYGDTPLLRLESLEKMIGRLDEGADIVVLGFEAADPTGYGRLLRGKDGSLEAIREEKDASESERAVTLCNSGVFAFNGKHLLSLLERIGNDNKNGEYYLTDTVELAGGDGLRVEIVTCREDEVLGVNSRSQLAHAEAIYQQRLRERAMDEGATLLDPSSVYFSFDTQIGRDVIIEPHVFFGPGVSIADNVHIKAFCHIEQASIGAGAAIGPYARLRPAADIGEKAKVGNFVEIKKSKVEEGAKVSHLTYIGDARIGRGANIGAGTITCNYDGFNKHFTDIGEGAFIGSNSALVAPVKIGDGAFVGSGSVVTRNVDPDALVVSRARQVQRDDWANKFRAMNERKTGKRRK